MKAKAEFYEDSVHAVILYGYEVWYPKLSEEQRLRVRRGIYGPTRQEAARQRRTL
jgi:hypothetical protein